MSKILLVTKYIYEIIRRQEMQIHMDETIDQNQYSLKYKFCIENYVMSWGTW